MSFFLTGDSKRKNGKKRAAPLKAVSLFKWISLYLLNEYLQNGKNGVDEVPKKSKRKNKLDEVEVSSDEDDIQVRTSLRSLSLDLLLFQYGDGHGESDTESVHEDANQTAFRKAHELLNSLKAGEKDEDEVRWRSTWY